MWAINICYVGHLTAEGKTRLLKYFPNAVNMLFSQPQGIRTSKAAQHAEVNVVSSAREFSTNYWSKHASQYAACSGQLPISNQLIIYRRSRNSIWQKLTALKCTAKCAHTGCSRGPNRTLSTHFTLRDAEVTSPPEHKMAISPRLKLEP